MTASIATEQPPAYRDRRTGLLLFGALLLLIGAVWFLFVLWTVMSVLLLPAADPARGQALPFILGALLLYAGLALAFGWLGIGSILCRRWARAIILAASWLWLFGGLTVLVVFVQMAPGMFASLPDRPWPPGAETFLVVTMVLVLGGIMVLLPAALILFYGSPSVKTTCEVRDARVRWTDRCPQAVLPLVIGLAWGAFGGIYAVFAPFPMPVFGMVLTGASAALLMLALGFLDAALAWGAYRLRPAAWWAALGLTVFWTTSTILTSGRLDASEIYAGTPIFQDPEQLAVLDDALQSAGLTWTFVASSAVVVVYLLYVRRYFFRRPRPLEAPV